MDFWSERAIIVKGTADVKGTVEVKGTINIMGLTTINKSNILFVKFSNLLTAAHRIHLKRS